MSKNSSTRCTLSPFAKHLCSVVESIPVQNGKNGINNHTETVRSTITEILCSSGEKRNGLVHPSWQTAQQVLTVAPFSAEQNVDLAQLWLEDPNTKVVHNDREPLHQTLYGMLDPKTGPSGLRAQLELLELLNTDLIGNARGAKNIQLKNLVQISNRSGQQHPIHSPETEIEKIVNKQLRDLGLGSYIGSVTLTVKESLKNGNQSAVSTLLRKVRELSEKHANAARKNSIRTSRMEDLAGVYGSIFGGKVLSED